MARMHPFYKEDEIVRNITGPGYVGERELYRLLRDMPGTEKWDVLYNDRFHHDKKDSQTDFLVFVPNKGIVNVDAKGNGYRYYDNQWYLGNEKDDIFEQADKAIHTFNRYVQTHLVNNKTWGAFGRLIVFVEKPEGEIPGDYHYVLPQSDMALRIKEAIESELGNHPNAWKNFDNNTYKIILSHWCQKFGLKPFCFDFQNNDNQLESLLTLKQREIMAAIETNTFTHVTGGAGTGKTLLAIACAEKFAEQSQRVLYVCFNKSLANYWKNVHQQRRFTITHFDVIPQELFNKNFEYSKDAEGKIDWEKSRERICDLLIDAVDDNYLFDCILVDEAQDMTFEQNGEKISMLDSLQFLRKGESSKMVFFSDSVQSIFQKGWKFPKDCFDEEVEENKLRVNMRNTDNIHSRIIAYSGESTKAAGLVTGKKPEIFKRSVIELIEALYDEGIQPYDIAVLAYNTDTLSAIKSDAPKGIYFTDKLIEWDRDKQKILRATVQSFKGLEANVVIIVDAPALDGNKNNQLNYVGESRAKYRLYIHSAD